MPPTFHLKDPIGGLGNQMFQVCSLVSICKDLSANLSLPVYKSTAWGMVTSPSYWNTVFRNIVPMITPTHEFTVEYDMVKNNQQFTYLDFSKHKETNDNVMINGILMNTKYFFHNLDYLRSFFVPPTDIPYILNDGTHENLCLGVRRFVEEKRQNEWAFPATYFSDALDRFFEKYDAFAHEKPLRLAIFTDDTDWCKEFIESYQAKKNRAFPVFCFQAKRDGYTDAYHFFEMFHCKHFILCSSSFHYWAALLAEKPDSIVVCCPRDFLNDIVQPHWLRVDF